MRRLYSVIGALIITVAGMMTVLPVSAAVPVNTPKGIADFGRGNAEITIKGNEGQTLKGKSFQLYKLFCVENAEGTESVNYTFHQPFAKALKSVVGKKISKETGKVTEYEVVDYIQSLKNSEGAYSEYRYFVEGLRNEIVKEGISGDMIRVTQTRPDNSIVIGGLDYGYYIVDEVTSVGGTHSAASLCIVSTANPKTGVNIKSDYPSIVKKIQEDDNRDLIGTNGWNDIADFEIGQNVPYKYESNIPNISGYDKYYYAWHDVMDQALTFKKDSVKIVIQGTADPKSKTYQLKNDEFNLITDPGNRETFKIEIQDMKAIADREFPKLKTYGQRVILTYEAVLNDEAALDTGRPGFENDVRLEFSNDADQNNGGSTGYTPWDTVVCFTYKINGLKTNDSGVKLEGAKFRLYSDASCKKEVYVKASGDGYHVINRDSSGGTIPKDAVEMISDENGGVKIYGVDGGIYYLKETKAPAGYRQLLDVIEIRVSPEFTNDREHYVKGDGATEKTLRNLTASAHMKEFTAGAYKDRDINLATDVDAGSVNLAVVNTAGRKLPVTGSGAMLILLGTGSVMVIYALTGKKKKK